MWLRLGIQTDFSLTNTTGIRADLVPGPVTVEQMFNIFPFDNSITKMQLSGVEVQDLFDFVAAPLGGPRLRARRCRSRARVVIDCAARPAGERGAGRRHPHLHRRHHRQSKCANGATPSAGGEVGSCDVERSAAGAR